MLEQLNISDPIDDIVGLQSDFLISKPIQHRKTLGQFFTGSIVSHYMASLVDKPKGETVRILDAGAGTGILTASAALRCLDLGCKRVHAVLYELDRDVQSNLEQTLRIVQSTFELKRASFTFEIRYEDFVLSRPDQEVDFEPFDVSVINPPYFKYNVKTSPYAKAASDLYRGDPNIYASFLAVVIACLSDKGQMVTITPRSFTNGLYFKGFRSYLLGKSSLNLIHIFKHRDKVFKNSDSDVLQENIICRFTKSKGEKTITIRSSDCDESIHKADEQNYSENFIIDPSNDQKLIRIPESAYEANILRQAEKFEETFESAGYFISTGPVVEHRARQFITADTNEKNSIPLYRPHNVTWLCATWDGNNKKDVSFKMDDGHEKHTLINATYVLLKRFSSKDEKRRLVSGVHFPKKNGTKFIGFGNKVNYIGVVDAKLSESEAYGVSAIFNSSFMDKYFRCISGNTQVNATEIRVMRFPSREQVNEIGQLVKNLNSYEVEAIDLIVNSTLGLTDIV